MKKGERGKERGDWSGLGEDLWTRAKVLLKNVREKNQVMSQTVGTDKLSLHFGREWYH